MLSPSSKKLCEQIDETVVERIYKHFLWIWPDINS